MLAGAECSWVSGNWSWGFGKFRRGSGSFSWGSPGPTLFAFFLSRVFESKNKTSFNKIDGWLNELLQSSLDEGFDAGSRPEINVQLEFS